MEIGDWGWVLRYLRVVQLSVLREVRGRKVAKVGVLLSAWVWQQAAGTDAEMTLRQARQREAHWVGSKSPYEV